MLIRNKFNGYAFDGSRRAHLDMGDSGGGGTAQPAQQTVTQTNIPAYAEPYVTDMLGRAEALTTQTQYQPYAGQQVAGFTPMQAQAFQNIAGQQTAGQIGEASDLASQVGRTALGAFSQGQQLGQEALGYGGMGTQYAQTGVQQALTRADEIARQARLYGAQGTEYGGKAAALSPEAQRYGAQAAGLGMQGLGYGQAGFGMGARGALAAEQGFGAGQRFEQMATSPGAQAAYMSPYMQNAVDWQKEQAIRDYNINRQAEQARAVGAGAYGGSRQAVAQAEGNRALMNQLAGIQATGTQKAFEDAQRQMQFGAQLGLQGLGAGYQGLQTGMQGANLGLAGLGLGIQGQQAGVSGLGQAGQLYGLGMQGAGVGLQSAAAQQGAGQLALAGTGQGMQGAGLGLQGVQGAVGAGQYGLAGLGQAGSAASTLGALGQTQFGQQAAINEAMARAGQQQQALQQRGLDVQYQQYLDSLNYPYKQIGFMSDVLRGLPLSQGTSTVYQAPPNLFSQIGGAGAALYAGSKLFKKGGKVKKRGSGLADLALHKLVG